MGPSRLRGRNRTRLCIQHEQQDKNEGSRVSLSERSLTEAHSVIHGQSLVGDTTNASWVYCVGNNGKGFTTQHPQRSLGQCLNMFRVQLLQPDIQH